MKKEERIKLWNNIDILGATGDYTVTEIANKLGCHTPCVRKRLDASNIIVKDGRGGKNAKILSNPFIPRTSESDYWIGFLVADGWLTSYKNNIGLSQGGLNYNFMDEYLKFIGGDASIYKDKKRYMVRFGNRETYEWLISIGFLPEKSLNIKLKIAFNWDILRGLFDGDGGFVNKNVPRITSGSRELVNQISKFLSDYDIKHSIDVETEKCMRIRVLKRDRDRFCTLLYKDAKVYIQRKYDIYYAPCAQ